MVGEEILSKPILCKTKEKITLFKPGYYIVKIVANEGSCYRKLIIL